MKFLPIHRVTYTTDLSWESLQSNILKNTSDWKSPHNTTKLFAFYKARISKSSFVIVDGNLSPWLKPPHVMECRILNTSTNEVNVIVSIKLSVHSYNRVAFFILVFFSAAAISKNTRNLILSLLAIGVLCILTMHQYNIAYKKFISFFEKYILDETR